MSRSFLLIILSLLLFSISLSAFEFVYTSWQVPIRITHGAKTDTLIIGTHENATESFDFNLDQLAFPPPPDGAAIFLGEPGLFGQLRSDIRSSMDSTHQWKLYVLNLSLNDRYLMHWDTSQLPSADVPGRLFLNKMDMFTCDSVSIDHNTTLTITYHAPKNAENVAVNIKTIPDSIRFTINGIAYFEEQWFDLIPQNSYTIGNLSTIINNDSRFSFQYWNESKDTSSAIIVPYLPSVITAVFFMQHRLSLISEPEAGGTILANPSELWITKDDSVTLQAITNDSYKFINWSGDASGKNSEISVIMDMPKTIVAHFSKSSDIVDRKIVQPIQYHLSQNWPNPFNSTTKIQYELPEPSWVRISLVNIHGVPISQTIYEHQSAGSHVLFYDLQIYPGGLYIYCLNTRYGSIMKKMLYIK